MSFELPFKKELSARGIGILALVLGVIFTYLGVFQPIWDAVHQEPSVSVSMKAVIIAPFVLAFGLVSTILGDKAARFLSRAFLVFFFLLGIVLYWWVKSTVESYGYSFNS